MQTLCGIKCLNRIYGGHTKYWHVTVIEFLPITIEHIKLWILNSNRLFFNFFGDGNVNNACIFRIPNRVRLIMWAYCSSYKVKATAQPKAFILLASKKKGLPSIPIVDNGYAKQNFATESILIDFLPTKTKQTRIVLWLTTYFVHVRGIECPNFCIVPKVQSKLRYRGPSTLVLFYCPFAGSDGVFLFSGTHYRGVESYICKWYFVHSKFIEKCKTLMNLRRESYFRLMGSQPSS